jgi:subtilisin-like proprotein convertase family protein
MSEENKALVRHGPTGTEGEVRGLEDFKVLVSMYHTALPDLRVPVPSPELLRILLLRTSVNKAVPLAAAVSGWGTDG